MDKSEKSSLNIHGTRIESEITDEEKQIDHREFRRVEFVSHLGRFMGRGIRARLSSKRSTPLIDKSDDDIRVGNDLNYVHVTGYAEDKEDANF